MLVSRSDRDGFGEEEDMDAAPCCCFTVVPFTGSVFPTMLFGRKEEEIRSGLLETEEVNGVDFPWILLTQEKYVK